MTKKFFAKGTLLIPTGTTYAPNKKHLHVICNDACKDGFHLIVSISTWTNERCDDACILQPGSHAFIKNKSYVSYRHTRLVKDVDLIKGVEDGIFTVKDDFREFDFLTIKYGILRSKQTKRKIKKYAINVMGIKLPK